jgi:hypothetical protein
MYLSTERFGNDENNYQSFCFKSEFRVDLAKYNIRIFKPVFIRAH